MIRDKIIPVGMLVVAIFIPAFGIATARADDTVTPAVADYTQKYHAAVCSTLDEYPSANGVKGIVLAITNEGWTGAEAGQIIRDSVIGWCPEHVDAIQAFVRRYSPANQIIA